LTQAHVKARLHRAFLKGISSRRRFPRDFLTTGSDVLGENQLRASTANAANPGSNQEQTAVPLVPEKRGEP
jgi:tagatose-1,6-bisphosphate aldolase non-catalytic subunit AgaZ/GatZ